MRRAVWMVGLLLLGLVSSGRANALPLSTNSSDATPASQLDALLDFSVVGSTLTITLTNPSAGEGGDALFNINEVYWNAAPNVTGVSLVSATHSANGDVFTEWNSLVTNSMVDGFGNFDFGLTDGVGNMSPGTIMPGQNVVFVLDITGTGPFSATDFIQANSMSYYAAAKFVNGPDDPENPGFEDSAYGATLVPEPASAGLLALGLLGLGAAGRRR